MAFVQTKRGSYFKGISDFTGTVNVDVGLYNDDTDQITKQHNLSDITTEPSDGNYARQTVTLELAEGTNVVKIRNAADITFDLTDTTGEVNAVFIEANFAYFSESAADNLIATFPLKDSEGAKTLTLSDETSWPIDSGMLSFGS